ncbi:MAG: response regulator [Methanophagales archaeon]|nr:response regulator [Methanophagales archaeon]
MKGKPAVILLVEDDEAHAILIIRSFEDTKLGNKIYLVSDGEEALDYLFRRGKYADKEKSPRPDLILLDLQLPKLDGHEVLKEVKKSDDLKSIPVVVLTVSESEGDIAQAYSNYANSYLVKPVDFGEFSEMIRDLGHYWLVLNKKINY